MPKIPKPTLPTLPPMPSLPGFRVACTRAATVGVIAASAFVGGVAEAPQDVVPRPVPSPSPSVSEQHPVDDFRAANTQVPPTQIAVPPPPEPAVPPPPPPPPPLVNPEVPPRSVQAVVTQPFPGVTMVEHPGQSVMAVIDLHAPGVEVRASTYEERKATVDGWAQREGVQVAMNGDFFDHPGWSRVMGRARAEGVDWPAGAHNHENRPYWEFGPGVAGMVENGAAEPNPAATDIVGGHNVLIREGQVVPVYTPEQDGAVVAQQTRRSGLGLSQDGRFLYMMSADKHANGYQFAEWMMGAARDAGAPAIAVATSQDGGGSAGLYQQGRGNVVDSDRPLGNVIGVFARG